jgi:hypothetical protein
MHFGALWLGCCRETVVDLVWIGCEGRSNFERKLLDQKKNTVGRMEVVERHSPCIYEAGGW